MLASVSGTAMAAAPQTMHKQTVTQEAKKETGTAKSIEDKKQEQKAAEKDDKEKKETSLYGTIFKIDKEKMELKTASMIWEKDELKTDVKTEAKTETKKAEASDKKDTKTSDKSEPQDAKADFETNDMKWKLDGKSLVVKFDKDTRFLKQVKAEKDVSDQKGQDKKADDKKDQKSEKAADTKVDTKADTVRMENESIKLEDLKEGMFVTVKVTDISLDKLKYIAEECGTVEDIREML